MPKRTPLYEEHKKLGAKLVEFAGWEMPVQYSGVTDEHLAVRNAAGLFDVSHMGTFEISGDDASAFLNYLTPSDIDRLSDMQAVYSLLLTEKGTIVDDIIIYKINSKKFLIVVNALNIDKDFGWIEKNLGEREIILKNLSSDYALLAIQGPKAASILSKITDISIDDIKTFHMSAGKIRDVGDVILARTGYTGEDGFEIFAPPDKAAVLWNSLLETGKDEGIKPIGLAARDTLRLEMKYALYGHEISEETNALEAGLRWVIKFKKPSDFIGKDSLIKIRNSGLKRKLIGFKMIDKGIPRHGYGIFSDDKKIGEVTSGTFSPSLKTAIGIGYVSVDFSDIGSKISVDIRGNKRLAECVQTPFYERLAKLHLKPTRY